MVATPARSVAGFASRRALAPAGDHRRFIDGGASRLRSSGFAARPMSAGNVTTPTSNCEGLLGVPRRMRRDGARGLLRSAAEKDQHRRRRRLQAMRRGQDRAGGDDGAAARARPADRSASFRLSSTTGEPSVEQSAPLTIAVPVDAVDWVRAPQALLNGSVGTGRRRRRRAPVLPPPHAETRASARATARTSAVRLLLISGFAGMGQAAPPARTARAGRPSHRSTACRACR